LANVIQGELPSPIAPPAGCRFHTRCPTATPECSKREPRLVEIAAGHYAQDCACVVAGAA
jgi:oligopeptide/dipeptide ABC transporter ATP-binding protein